MDAQQIAALGIVALAAGWLGLRLWRQVRGDRGDGAGCPGCGECGRPPTAAKGVRAAPEAKPLITLGMGSQKPSHRPKQGLGPMNDPAGAGRPSSRTEIPE